MKKIAWKAWLRRFGWAAAIGAVVFVVAVILGIRSISEELDSKFFQSFDSVPTRVYSALYRLRPGTGASVEELRFRFKERDYRELAQPDEVRSPGTFALQIVEGRPVALAFFTNDFPYAPAVKEVLFGNPQANTGPARFTVSWVDGRATEVHGPSGEVIPEAVLEPVLVAQLNQGNVEARKTLPLAQIPHTLMKGIVLTEDQRFLEHGGIDPRGILRSIYVNLRSGGYVQGASTITQQLARNIYLTRQRTITRKLKEMAVSIYLELNFSKDQILEKYLNEVYFGQSGSVAIHGVAEAAKFYFNKTLDELSIAEQALLGGIVRGPFYYSPFRHYERAKSRQEIVLGKMLEAGVITADEHKAAVAEKLKFARVNPVQNTAPYFTDMVQAQLLRDLPEQEVVGAGFTIFSTLDTYQQRLAEKSVADGVAAVEAKIKQYVEKRKKDKPEEEEARLVQGVYVGVDPTNGQLLSLVGGRSYEESNYNRALLMRRHIGSLVKPFVYLAALMHGTSPDGTPVNAISKYEDKPFTYNYDEKTWTPKNYDEEFAGVVTMRYALANSINTVAAQVAIATGLDKVAEVAMLAGMGDKIRALPSLSLGAVELAPLEIAEAYTTLANFGVRRELTSTLVVVDDGGRMIARFQAREERKLPPEETANLVNLMTSAFEIGTARSARAGGFSWPAAGKTGTTNEYRDAWFAGFTKKVLGIAWIGFDRDDEIVRRHRTALKLTGATAALPVWTSIMNALHRGQAGEALSYPDGILRKLEVDLISGGKANHRCMGDSVVEETFTYRNMPHFECN